MYLVTDFTTHFLKTASLTKAIAKADSIANGADVLDLTTNTRVHRNAGTVKAKTVTTADIIRNRK